MDSILDPFLQKKMQSWLTHQLINKGKVIRYDCFDLKNIQYIGGLDISFDKKDSNYACAFLTVYDLKSKLNVYEDYLLCRMTVPYITGFLAFRENPFYGQLLTKAKATKFYPHVLMVDGSGILHPREFGSACQLGLEHDIPTIGIAKTLLSFDGLKESKVKQEFREKCKKKGDVVFLKGESNIIWGAAVKTSETAMNPVYVSLGHKISLETSVDLVAQTSLFKNPEPIRNSDIKSKLYFT